MADVTFKRDSAGLAALLKSGPFAAAVESLAEDIASNVAQRRGADVVVDRYTTDRAAASVTVRDRRALKWEAEDGDLHSAATGMGLDVRSKA